MHIKRREKKVESTKAHKKKKRMKKPRVKQLTIFSGTWGGAREGSGPKPKPGAGVPHDRRESFDNKPVHVTLRLLSDLRGLRQKAEFEVILAALEAGGQRPGFRLVHYSVQWDHLHLILECAHEHTLAAGMKGLCVRIARGLNRLWNRKGKVFADRYHSRAIESAQEMRNVLRYVLLNGRKHGAHNVPGPDPYSSGHAFEGWLDRDPELAVSDPRIARPRTWQMTRGLRTYTTPMATYEIPRHSTNPHAFATYRKAERRLRRRSRAA